ncbi:protein ALP1-like, partial [Scomber scombrus]
QFQPETERYIAPVLMDTEGAPGEWQQAIQGDTNLLDTRRLTAARATHGMAVCNRFKDYFLTDEGRVTWQDAVVQRGTLQ